MKTRLSPEEQWDRTASMAPFWGDVTVLDGDGIDLVLEALYGEMDVRVNTTYLGRIRYNTRLFLAGDIVQVHINNGQAERFPVDGVSSRGYRVRYKYMRVRRWNYRPDRGASTKRESGPLELLEPPRELVGRPLTDAAVRAWVKTLGPEVRP